MQGIESLGPNVAEKLAAMGQFEDDQIAHVAEGEVIVPAPIMKYFPEVREQVFSAIRETGLEPEQFIVGGDMVAVNPNTGIQEFSFLKKAFKKNQKVCKESRSSAARCCSARRWFFSCCKRRYSWCSG